LQAIASRNRVKSVAKQRESQQQQLRALIKERRAELERFVVVLFIAQVQWVLQKLFQVLAFKNITTSIHL